MPAIVNAARVLRGLHSLASPAHATELPRMVGWVLPVCGRSAYNRKDNANKPPPALARALLKDACTTNAIAGQPALLIAGPLRGKTETTILAAGVIVHHLVYNAAASAADAAEPERVLLFRDPPDHPANDCVVFFHLRSAVLLPLSHLDAAQGSKFAAGLHAGVLCRPWAPASLPAMDAALVAENLLGEDAGHPARAVAEMTIHAPWLRAFLPIATGFPMEAAAADIRAKRREAALAATAVLGPDPQAALARLALAMPSKVPTSSPLPTSSEVPTSFVLPSSTPRPLTFVPSSHM